MNGQPPTPEPSVSRFSAIQTRPDVVNDPHAILNVYGKAIRRFVAALLARIDGDEDDVSEVVQDFSCRILRGAFSDWPQAGRFRNYLKTSVHHAVVDFIRQKKRRLATFTSLDDHLTHLVDPRTNQAVSSDEVWLGLYREAILAEAMRELKAFEEKTPDNAFHTLIRLVEQQPSATSEELAKLLGASKGRSYEPGTVRKHLQRARDKAEELRRAIVGRYVSDPSEVDGELQMLGLSRASADS
jgi:DNA-directed RNA polymerase specialized sigma24 family protein